MTDEELIKALECCDVTDTKCEDCPLWDSERSAPKDICVGLNYIAAERLRELTTGIRTILDNLNK